MNGALQALVGVAIAVVILARQMMPRRVSWLMLLGVPVLLAYFAIRRIPAGPIGAQQALELVLEFVLALGCGLWQTSVTRVYANKGHWYRRSGWPYLAAWVVLLVGDIVMQGLVAGTTALSQGTGLWITLLGAAVCWAVRAVGIIVKYPQVMSAAPSAPVEGDLSR